MRGGDPVRVGCCMCTWNESRMVPLAVESTKDFVDRYVVVDCDSDDGTREVIEKIGAWWGLDVEVHNKPNMRLRVARAYAIERMKDCNWILICDGDEVFHTDGPNNIMNLKRFLKRKNVVSRAPMNYLSGDLLHTQPGKTRLVGHKFLYHNNGTLEAYPTRRYDLPVMRGSVINLNRVYKFNCNVKSPRRMFLRNYWYEWCKASDAYKRVGIEEYVKRKLGVEDLTESINRWWREYKDTLAEYDEEKYGYYPRVIREYIHRGRIRGCG